MASFFSSPLPLFRLSEAFGFSSASVPFSASSSESVSLADSSALVRLSASELFSVLSLLLSASLFSEDSVSPPLLYA